MVLSEKLRKRKAAIIDMVVSHGTECECRFCTVFHAAPLGESTNEVIRRMDEDAA